MWRGICDTVRMCLCGVFMWCSRFGVVCVIHAFCA